MPFDYIPDVSPKDVDPIVSEYIHRELTRVSDSAQAEDDGIVNYISKFPGADPTGGSDSTSAVQAAFTTGGAVCIDGEFLVNDTLVIDKPIYLFGYGDNTRLIVDASHTGDIISISSASDSFNHGYVLRDFRITPESGTPGRYGIAIDIQTKAAYDCEFHRVWIDELGGNAIRTIPHATPIIDGYFTSVINNCTLHGGIYLDKAGDSIRITNNTITGPNTGVYADLVGVGLSDGGAHGLDIIGNNITCDDGALEVINAWAGRFSNNNVEVPSPGTLPNSAAISIDGASGNVIRGFVISQNMLTTGAGNDTIFVGRSHGTVVKNNYVARQSGQHSYVIGANSVNAVLKDNTEALDETMATVLSNSGTGTLWMRTFGGVVETNQLIGGYHYPTSQTVADGTVITGGYAGVSDWNASYFQIEEASGAPGFDVILDFSNLLTFTKLVWVGRYTGNPAHNIQLEMYDYVAAAWRIIDLVISDSADELHSYAIPEALTRFISAGVARVRFNHTSSGITSHDLYIDYLALLT